MPATEVLTIEQLADYLQIAKSTAYKLAQEGRIPAQKVGKHWRFHRGAIDRWIAGVEAPRRADDPGLPRTGLLKAHRTHVK
ncbi:MAG: DNA-binding protein [Alphaproteobacteria bacterium]|nr:MAG: DNA-binding protein [Alphaproteobacteria bacterium]